MLSCALCGFWPGMVIGASTALTFGGVWLIATLHAAKPVTCCQDCGRRLLELEKPEGRCRQCLEVRITANHDCIEDLR